MKTLAIGASIVDIIYQIPNLPGKGGDVYIQSINKMVGGCAFNVANILKLNDCDYDLFTPLGEGENGNLIKQTYDKLGHKILISEATKDNGFCLALVTPDGERTFITQTGIEDEVYDQWLTEIDFGTYQNYYIDGYRLYSPDSEKIVEHLELKAKGKNIYFAPGPMITLLDQKLLKRFFNLQPIVHLNRQELIDYTNINKLEDALIKLANQTQNLVIVTDGENGCYYYDNGEIKHIKGVQTQVVDTIGAGDVHIATFIAARSLNKSLEQALIQANRIAAKAVATKGTNFNKAILEE